MRRFCVLLVTVVAISQTLGSTLRSRRQIDDQEGELEDRYGWNRPNQRPIFIPIQFPDQREFPGQNQLPGQIQFPSQRPVFPGIEQNQLPGQDQVPPTQPTNNNNGQGTSQSVQECMRTCPVTPEYNPVCGSNRVQYNNPGSLTCAQRCGVTVSLWRQTPCPSQTASSSS